MHGMSPHQKLALWSTRKNTWLWPQISVRLVGLALSYTLQLSGLLQWAVRQTAEAENDMTSVERVLQYTHLDQEPARLADGAPPPPKCALPPLNISLAKQRAAHLIPEIMLRLLTSSVQSYCF